MFKNRRILCPTDFSPPSVAAFELACSLARDHQAEVSVLHVARPPVTYDDVVESRKPGFRDGLRAQLHGMRPADPAVAVAYLLMDGDPAEVILDWARGQECDLIVMGTHGRSGIGRLVLGSVAEAVLRKALCPVLTAKEHTAELAPATRALPVAVEE